MPGCIRSKSNVLLPHPHDQYGLCHGYVGARASDGPVGLDPQRDRALRPGTAPLPGKILCPRFTRQRGQHSCLMCVCGHYAWFVLMGGGGSSSGMHLERQPPGAMGSFQGALEGAVVDCERHTRRNGTHALSRCPSSKDDGLQREKTVIKAPESSEEEAPRAYGVTICVGKLGHRWQQQRKKSRVSVLVWNKDARLAGVVLTNKGRNRV